jgi:heterodisulfide reductase subunit A
VIVRAEDTGIGRIVEIPVDMVVLAVGLEPHPDQREVGHMFGVSRSPDGFFLEKHPKLGPIDTANDGVYIAGACQSPKDIPDTVAQGAAAAAAAIALMDKGKVEIEPITAYVNQAQCGGCRVCVDICPYNAISRIEVDGRMVAEVNEALCKACGTCVGACPAGAITQRGFSNEQIYAEIEGALALALA